MRADEDRPTDRGVTNICFVSPKFHGNTVGGGELQLYLMAKGLAQLDDCRVFYVTPDITQSEVSDGIELIKIPSKNGTNDCSYSEFSTILDSVSPDIILQLGRKRFTYYAARYCKLSGVPFIFGAASDIDCRYFRQMPRFIVEYPIRRALNPRRLGREFTMDVRTFFALRTATVTLAQSRQQQALLQRVVNSDTVIFQNPHDVPDIHSVFKAEPPIVLWLASIKSAKRPELFIDIAEKLKDYPCRIVLAGQMSEKRYRNQIEAAEERGLLEYVEKVTFEQSNDWIASASIFVLTSIYEGLPNTLIQSWLRGTPTVSYGFDPDSMIEKHDLGAYTKTIDEAVSAIKHLLGDRHAYERVAGNARAFAVEHFGMKTQARRLKGIVDAAIRG